MRTPSLQYLYLQKPITTVILVCVLAVLPWIGLGDFATKGEPREAAVAVSMLETGNWVLPGGYADEFSYKPPMDHWLMAIFSLPEGYVSEFTARLPSALAYIFLIGVTLFFFGERIKFQEAFICSLLLITCFEIHRAGMTARVDMLVTTFIVLGLFALYRWEDRLELKGLPVSIPLLLGCATLTKGPVGIVLPLFVFGVYLLALQKYRLKIIFKALLYVGISSLFLPLIWYVAAWRQGGDEFLNLVLAENFGRFFHIDNFANFYDLGHENGIWYNFATLLSGFLPWTILFLFSLFGITWRRPTGTVKAFLVRTWSSIRSMEKLKLFSLTALVCIIVFYSIPSSKRSVYLMSAYPFIAIFLAQYALYIVTYRTKATRVFAGFLAGITAIVLIAVGLSMAGIIDPVILTSQYTHSASTLRDVETISRMFTSPDWLTIGILVFVLIAFATVIYQWRRKINLKMLYATIFLAFTINLLIDGVVMRGIRDADSSRPFAERILKEYPLNKQNIYVMNNLKEYSNLYGLNFYMKSCFHNFELAKPANGYFLIGDKDADKVISRHPEYIFTPLTSTDYKVSDLKQRILLFQIIKRRL
ncbi:hypothetical protein AGMMS49574_26450 [Bacteroidia bacterium]|nr:hypothetical protein AGMMS49574_26450 [Bacteroidia bacterium]